MGFLIGFVGGAVLAGVVLFRHLKSAGGKKPGPATIRSEEEAYNRYSYSGFDPEYRGADYRGPFL